jgi:hypothetical protein
MAFVFVHAKCDSGIARRCRRPLSGVIKGDDDAGANWTHSEYDRSGGDCLDNPRRHGSRLYLVPYVWHKRIEDDEMLQVDRPHPQPTAVVLLRTQWPGKSFLAQFFSILTGETYRLHAAFNWSRLESRDYSLTSLPLTQPF